MWVPTCAPTSSSPASSWAAARARSTSPSRAGSRSSDSVTLIVHDCAALPPDSCKAGPVRALLGVAVLLILAACAPQPEPQPPVPAAPSQLRAHVLETVPHDTDAFTEGLEIDDGIL